MTNLEPSACLRADAADCEGGGRYALPEPMAQGIMFRLCSVGVWKTAEDNHQRSETHCLMS